MSKIQRISPQLPEHRLSDSRVRWRQLGGRRSADSDDHSGDCRARIPDAAAWTRNRDAASCCHRCRRCREVARSASWTGFNPALLRREDPSSPIHVRVHFHLHAIAAAIADGSSSERDRRHGVQHILKQPDSNPSDPTTNNLSPRIIATACRAAPIRQSALKTTKFSSGRIPSRRKDRGPTTPAAFGFPNNPKIVGRMFICAAAVEITFPLFF